MKKSIITFCAAACFAVLPTVSHAAETSNGGQVFEQALQMKSFTPQFNLEFMQHNEQSIVLKKQLLIDKEEIVKQLLKEQQSVVVGKGEGIEQATPKEELTEGQPPTKEERPVLEEEKEPVEQSTSKDDSVTTEQEDNAKPEQSTPTDVEPPENDTEEQPQANEPELENLPEAVEPPKNDIEEQPQVNEPELEGLSEVSQIERAVVELTNKEREKAGLAPLEMDTALMAAAREKSQDMKANNYFSHTSPTFGSPFDRLKALGISYQAAGENIAKGQKTAEEVVTAWMNSEGHRANILDAKFTHIGVGFVQDGAIWTQQFIKK